MYDERGKMRWYVGRSREVGAVCRFVGVEGCLSWGCFLVFTYVS